MSSNEPERQLSGRYIELPVREEFIPRVIEFLADLERGTHTPDAPAVQQAATHTEFGRDLVIRMYAESESRHRKLLRTLANRAGSWVFTAELAEALGITGGSKAMGGMFGAFGRRAKHRYGGQKPWKVDWDPFRGEAKYLMEPQVAEWIQQAVKQGGG